jgi:hypothetical protein
MSICHFVHAQCGTPVSHVPQGYVLANEPMKDDIVYWPQNPNTALLVTRRTVVIEEDGTTSVFFAVQEMPSSEPDLSVAIQTLRATTSVV